MPEKLKNGWTRVAFGDVVQLCRIRSSNPAEDGYDRYVGLEHIDPGDLKIRRWGNVEDGTTFTSVFRTGQVLFGKRRAYQKKVAIADFDGVCSGDIYVFEPKNEKLLPELLPFICQTDMFFEHAVGTSAGSLSPRTNWESLASYEFDLPPLEEQRKIAKVLSRIEELCNHLANCVYAASETLNAMTFDIFSRMHKDNSIEKIPLCNQLAEDICNGIFRKQEQFGSGMRMINVTDCYSDFEVPIDNLERVPVNTKEYNSFSACPGDVIFNRSSLVLSGIGHACIVPNTEENLVFECHLMRVRLNVNKMSSRYLTHYALSPHGRRYLLSRAQTTTMTTINQGDLQNMPVPCPHIDTQKQIAAQFDQILSLKRLLHSRRHHVSELARSFASNLLIPLDGELT